MSATWMMLALLGVSPVHADTPAPTRLDPALRMALRDQVAVGRAALARQFAIKAAPLVAGGLLVDVFVLTTDPEEARKIIEQWDGAVRTQAGNIFTAALPLAYVEELAQLDIIEYVEAAQPVRAKLNQSGPLVNADDVIDNSSSAQSAGLTKAYTGSGVLVGVVDSGIDCTHADFFDGSSATRLLGYWDQTTGTSGVAEITATSGTEYTGSALATGGTCVSATDGSSVGHGTHVAGIAASDDSTYRGMAPGSKIVAVKHNAQDAESGGTFATAVVDAVNYIFRKAQANSLPAVVNLSLGTSLGAHDGTSLFEKSLDGLLEQDGADKQGRAIVNAAGNENFSTADSEASTFGGIHATISQSSTTKAFDFLVRSSSTVFGTFGSAKVDIWLTAASDCTIQVDAYSKDSKAESELKIDMSAVTKGNSTAASSNTDGKFQIALDFSDSSNANNSKQHALVTISRVSGTAASAATYSFDLIFTGSCEGDAWLYPDLTAAVAFRKSTALPSTTNPKSGYAYVSGDSSKTMTIPGTGKKVITVGSIMGAGTWTDLNGTSHSQTSTTEGRGGTVGAISLFSSLGPTGDARTKPDLVAPGEPIISTLATTVTATDANKGNSTHHKLEGSSMAAPHVTGTVALMLQRNGCLTPTEIKSKLTGNVTTDSNTGTGSNVPNNTYGSGKLDTLKAVAAVTEATCTPNNTSENGTGTKTTTTTTTTTTSSSSSGCSLIPW